MEASGNVRCFGGYSRRAAGARFLVLGFACVVCIGTISRCGDVSAQNSRLDSIIAEYKRTNPRTNRTASHRAGDDALSTPLLPSPHQTPRQRHERMRNPFEDHLSAPNTEPAGEPYGVRQVEFHAESDNSPTRSMTDGDRGFSAHREQRADARLHDICFVNSQCGWAVGDHGAIWHTSDAGHTWSLRESGVDCPLKSVCFLNETQGIVVGGDSRPFLKSTRGIILKTDDGGRSWTRVSDRTIPALHRVHLEDASHGWAIGVPGAISASGMFFTSDGGRSWRAFPVPPDFTTETWKDFHFLNPQTGVGVTLNDSLYRFHGTLALARHPSRGTRRVAAMTHVRPAPSDQISSPQATFPQTQGHYWLVGKGGLMLKSEDYGANWSQPPEMPHGRAGNHFDFETIFAAGSKLWVAGSPGTRIFSSADAGRTWTSAESGIGTPIRKIVFVDEFQGYAVGDLGTILASFDGGTTWNTQRSGGTRVALLGVFARAEEIPYEVFAHYAAEQGYLAAVELPLRENESDIRENGLPWKDRVHDSLTRCGVAASREGWGFPLKQRVLNASPETLETLPEKIGRDDGSGDARGLGELRRELVAMIRMWRPNVILTADPQDANDPARALLARELREAIEIAQDSRAFPEQLHEIGLVPWKVEKFVHVLDRDRGGDFNVSATTYAERLGKPLNEIVFASRGLPAVEEPRKWPRSIGMRAVLDAHSHYNGLKNDLMSGIVIAPGNEARRIPAPSPFSGDAHYAQINRTISRHRSRLIELCEKHIGQFRSQLRFSSKEIRDFPGDPGVRVDGTANIDMYAQVREMVGELESEIAAQILLEMGLRFRDAGDWLAAESMFSLLIESYPQNPLAAAAMVWTIPYGASSEIRWNLQRRRMLFEENGFSHGDVPQSFAEDESASLLEEMRLRTYRRDLALQSRQFLKQYAPNELSRADLRFSLALLYREKENEAESDGVRFETTRRNFGRNSEILRVPGHGDSSPRTQSRRDVTEPLPGSQPFRELWSKRLEAEQWAQLREDTRNTERDRLCPLPFLIAKSAKAPPYLDGRFDDTLDKDVWLTANVEAFSPKIPLEPRISRIPPQITRVSTGFSVLRPGAASQESHEKNAFGSKPLGTQTMILYDEHCLYVALRCRKFEHFTYPQPDSAPRPRDPDLSGEDRVEILLDVDRDYHVAYRLTIDHRGWVRDECWNDASWNPALFVARDEDARHWMIEAAIPFESLVDFAPRPGTIWGVGLRRVVPEDGIECWNAEHSENLDGGYGFLLFE